MKKLTASKIKLYENVESLLNSVFLIKLEKKKAPSGDQIFGNMLGWNWGCDTGKLLNKK